MISTAKCFFPYGLCLAFALLLGCEAKAVEPESDPAPELKLTLTAPDHPIRPGETLSVAYTIKNLQPNPLLLAINQGEIGGIFATRTLTHGLVEVKTGRSIQFFERGICPVGEGFNQRHFHELAGGAEVGGVINVRWSKAGSAVPCSFPRGEYRLEVQYSRDVGHGGQFDEAVAAELWSKSPVVESNTAVATLRVAGWDEASILHLRNRIAAGEATAMATASVAQLDVVLPDVEHALFETEIPPKDRHDFQTNAVAYLRCLPFSEASHVTERIIESPNFSYMTDGAIGSLASFPRSIVGPWAIKRFHQHADDALLQGKFLAVLKRCQFKTDDPQVIAYMLDQVRSASPNQLSSFVAWYMLDACVALGSKNTREVVEEIRRRMDEIPSAEQKVRLAERMGELLKD